jgi:hypothetical protein
MNTQPVPIQPLLTPKEKAKLDELSIQIIDAQYKVEQCQAIVTSLTEKKTNYQGFLTVAQNNRAQAHDNKALADQLVQSALDLKDTSKTALGEIVLADEKTNALSANIKILIDKLIYAVTVLNRLSNDIVRKKALNPLISDQLVAMAGKASTDANNAVTLTLVALQSTFIAVASNMETEATLALEYTQAVNLYETLTGGASANTPSLRSSLEEAYHNADTCYLQTDKSCNIISQELDAAQANLNKAQVKLASLQSGLAAANAAVTAT